MPRIASLSFRHGSPMAARADAVKVGRRSTLMLAPPSSGLPRDNHGESSNCLTRFCSREISLIFQSSVAMPRIE
jgi:hypothetical protein